jgi:hypothetical protein
VGKATILAYVTFLRETISEHECFDKKKGRGQRQHKTNLLVLPEDVEACALVSPPTLLLLLLFSLGASVESASRIG